MTQRKSSRRFRRGNERIAELAAHPVIAAQIAEVTEATTATDRVYMRTLAEIRKAGNLTQTELAQTLGIEQAAVSKIERRDDMLLSTLWDFLAAAGTTHPRIVVDKEGVEVALDLDVLTKK